MARLQTSCGVYGAALLMLGACASPPTAYQGASLRDEWQFSELDLQTRVMGMADEYIAALTEAVYLVAEEKPVDPQERWLLQSFLRNGVGAAIDIASGPDPRVALLDMLVFTSLQRWSFEKSWRSNGFDPETGGQVLERLELAVAASWQSAATVLTDQQLETMRELIAAWCASNPERTAVSMVRFDEFTDPGRPASAGDRQRARGLVSNLSAVTASVDQLVLLGERLRWFAGRYPTVLGGQSELTTYRIANQPEFKRAVATLESIQSMSESVAARLDSVPADLGLQRDELFRQIQAERVATIQDAKAALSAIAEDAIDLAFSRLVEAGSLLVEQLVAKQQSLVETMGESRETMAAATLLSRELTGTAEVVDRIVQRFQGSPGSDVAPIQIADIRDVAAETARLVQKLNDLLRQTDEMVGDEGLGERLSQLRAATGERINQLLWPALVVIGSLLALILVVGISALRLMRRSRA